MVKCGKCGTENPDGSIRCVACGRELGDQGEDYKTMAILALVFGIVGFFVNPFCLISVAAIVLGIIGNVYSVNNKSMAMAGWILGICSGVFQMVIDFFCTFGLGIFC